MFKKAHNMMKINVKITPQTPLLVASGKTFDVTRPDMEFIRINTKEGETVYVPGSSIKGVLRAGLEAVLGESNPTICSASETMCHDLHKDKRNRKEKVPYKLHCPVCRMFGSGNLASRLEISDMFPFAFGDSETDKKAKINKISEMISSRTGIKIDRKTGKTKGGALFEYEILGGGELYGEFSLTNYELYQPGLLFMLFALSNDGFLRYGHSKSRGLGVLNFEIQSMKILQVGKLKGNKIKGVGVLHDKNDQYSDYGFYMKDNDVIDKEYPMEDSILYSTISLEDRETIDDVTQRFKNKINTFLEG